MRLSAEQVEKLYAKMSDENIEEVELKANGAGRLQIFKPVEKLTRISLEKRGRPPKKEFS
jgi:hypothetical protein